MRRLRTSGLQFVLALVLALALWTFVSFSDNPPAKKEVVVQLDIVPPPSSLIVVDPDTGQALNQDVSVDLDVSGPQADLNGWNNTDFSATADLSELGPGTHTVEIAVGKPRSARIRSQTPGTITVQLEPRAARTFDIEGQIRGRVPFLFASNPPSIGAEQAIVSGPEQLVNRVARVVVPIDLSGRTSTLNEDITLVAVDQSGTTIEGVTIEPQSTAVSVEIRPRVEGQRVAVAPNITGQPAPGYRTDVIDWNPKYVELIAPEQITTTLTTEPITLTSKTEPFTQTVKVTGLDESVQLLTTDTITVSVSVVPFQFPVNYSLFFQVTPINLAANLNATIERPGVTVTVSGTAEQFNQLATTTLQATVDLAGQGPGTVTLPVTINLPPGLQIVGDVPQVTVTLTEEPPPTTAPPPGEGGG